VVTPYKFRDQLITSAPRWLQRTRGYRLLFALGAIWDTLADDMLLAVKARYPGLLDPVHSLPYLGRDRRIRRGLAELNDPYAERLKAHLDVNRRRGMALLMLQQIKIMLAPLEFDAWLIHNRGTDTTPNETGIAFKLDSAGDFTNYETDWYWDDSGDMTRFWIVLSIPDASLLLDGLWGDPGLWGDGGYWGVEGDVSSWLINVQSIVQDFTPAHAHCEAIITLPSSEAAGFWAAPPDGDWDQWANRNPVALYT
jgi:hypothetical protein